MKQENNQEEELKKEIEDKDKLKEKLLKRWEMKSKELKSKINSQTKVRKDESDWLSSNDQDLPKDANKEPEERDAPIRKSKTSGFDNPKKEKKND